jgi:predicted nucleic acid-binding protein
MRAFTVCSPVAGPFASARPGPAFGVSTQEDRVQQRLDHRFVVVVESSWFIEDRLGPGAEATFLRSVTSGELRRQDLTDTDWERATGLVEAYADLGHGLVDASVVAIAERLGATTIATLNHRDFMVVRPRHIVAFELLP